MGMQDEIVEKVADRVVEKLNPLLAKAISYKTSGVLRGVKQISDYMQIVIKGEKMEYNGTTIRRWYRDYGFPMSKDPTGKWWTSKSLIDGWLLTRMKIMKKSVELGYKRPDARFSTGYLIDIHPEQMSAAQRARCFSEVKKDRIKNG